MKKLRYGIIGCGSMGREHIENIQALPRSEGGASVTALADPNADVGFFVPPPMAIAHHLVKIWAESKA